MAGGFFPDGAGAVDCGGDACRRAFRGAGGGDASAGKDVGRFLRTTTVGVDNETFFKGICPPSFLLGSEVHIFFYNPVQSRHMTLAFSIFRIYI